jgi:LmbE family N-acetylglucosaminyl deacetylase
LVLSPHQDDETIGCGLLIAEKTSRGIAVAVAVATDGRHGWYTPIRRPASDDIAEVRHLEWHHALDCLAVAREDRFEFGFSDGTLSENESELAARIADLFRVVRPSQVFVTRSADPHPDHRALARAAGLAVTQVYDSDPKVPDTGAEEGSVLDCIGARPEFFNYRVYPGAGLWSEGRPPEASSVGRVLQLVRAVLGLSRQRALLFRAPRSRMVKASAIRTYVSQSKLLSGELRYVWDTDVELYWPSETGHSPGKLDSNERSA